MKATLTQSLVLAALLGITGIAQSAPIHPAGPLPHPIQRILNGNDIGPIGPLNPAWPAPAGAHPRTARKSGECRLMLASFSQGGIRHV